MNLTWEAPEKHREWISSLRTAFNELCHGDTAPVYILMAGNVFAWWSKWLLNNPKYGKDFIDDKGVTFKGALCIDDWRVPPNHAVFLGPALST